MKILHVYNERNKFPYGFYFNRLDMNQRAELVQWLKDSGGKYNVDFFYWGLKTNQNKVGGEIHFKENDIGMAFKLEYI